MLKKVMLLVLILAALFWAVNAGAEATLYWDYPSDWNIITGYTVYFSAGGEQYNKTLNKADLVIVSPRVEYQGIEAKLNLAPGVAYSIYVTAFNANGESGPSNSVQHTRAAYVPPTDRLPPPVVSSPPSPSGLSKGS